MSDTVQNFELILKQQFKKKSSALYCDNTNQNQYSFKPHDVISSVSNQLKAIQDADAFKSDKRTVKKLQKYNNSMFTSVNNLSVLGEKTPKQATKFDTQCVTDTQLINVIENAEILDAHQGMTQEFETAFIHNIEFHSDKHLGISDIETVTNTHQIDANCRNNDYITQKRDLKDKMFIEPYNASDKCKQLECNTEKVNNTESNYINRKCKENKHLNNKVENTCFKTENKLNDNINNDVTEADQLSQVLETKTTKFKRKNSTNENFVHKNDSKDEHHLRIEKSDEFNPCIETNKDIDYVETPLSPIFENKNLIIRSKSPSPLVFNLDQFEQFETIALSMLESDNFNIGKHVVNSQILHKELYFNMNDEIDLIDSNVVSPVLEKDSIPKQAIPLILDVDNKLYTKDKANSENIINQVLKQTFQEDSKNKSHTSKDSFKDEILFSSDEEEKYIHREYQDLPFTCALETSFYNQSDVLEKTMYVGFQTASNRSIQICADSFARAKCLLGDVTSDENTVTDLVNCCDSSTKDKETGKVDSNIKTSSINLDKIRELSQITDLKTPTSSQVYFQTANNKRINLSEKALARCRKVFQDIDLDEKFECGNVKENSQENNIGDENNKQSKLHSCVTEVANTRDSINVLNNVVEGFDEEIVQEFENFEMSLEDIKESKKTFPVASKTLNHNIVTTSELSSDVIEDVLTDDPFHDALQENKNIPKQNKNKEDIVLSQIIGNLRPKKREPQMIIDTINCDRHMHNAENVSLFSNTFANGFSTKISCGVDKTNIKGPVFAHPSNSKTRDVGLKTANNKNIEVYTKHENTQNFKDCDLAMPKIMLNSKKYQDSIEMVNIDEPSTSKGFLGFKTANNKNKTISEKAWSKCKAVFNNIDSTELPKIGNKNYPNVSVEEHYEIEKDCINNLYTETQLTGFKTASNQIILISDESVVNTKSIFNDINLTELISKEKRYSQEIKDTELKKQLTSVKSDETIGFVGFKSASNKIINVSEKAIAQTRNIFNDIYSDSSKIFSKEEKEGEMEIDTLLSERNLIGFKTANNKNIKISNSALARTKYIFKDIDSRDFELPSVDRKDYPNFEVSKEKDPFSSKNVYQSHIEIKDFGIESNKNKPRCLKSDHPMIDPSIEELRVITEAGDIFKDKEREDRLNIRHDINQKEDSIAAKSLENNKAILPYIESKKSEDILVDTGFIGFHTANNKQVKISEKALAISRKMFQEFDNHDDFSVKDKNVKRKSLYPKEIVQENEINVEVSNALPVDKSTRTSFKGFQTASEKPVAISKSALEKSKQLFRDLDEINLEPISCYGFEQLKTVSTSPKELNFKDFQTASHRKVSVSTESLAKAKKLFNDLEIDNKKKEAAVKPSNFSSGFQTGNNKAITISEEALAKSKRLFSEIDDECNTNIRKKDKTIHRTEDIDAMLDTQVLNNFEESLHTEDFAISPKNIKRSGSPILSCPRAKKRKKFEVPYNVKQISKPIIQSIEKCTVKNNTICYRVDYKKTKTYTLKDLYNMSKDMPRYIDSYLSNIEYENLLQFKFDHKRNDSSNNNITIDLLKEEFLNSVNAKLVPNGWVDNHLKLILWKLISYEVVFKSLIVCTAKNVLEQLKYRYDKELYNAQRPALRKIFEKDDVPSKTLVLCVVGIYVDDVMVSSLTSTSSNIELFLTDGWYNIRCKIDKMLTQLVCSGKISAGTKIATSGAELIGCEQGVSPWEDTSAIRLKIFGNSTRLAKWDARLGYHNNGTISSQLSSIQVVGGKVSKLRVLVTRVYPALYVEKFEDGSTVTRSERLENIHQMKTEAERQALMEKLYEEVEREFADQQSQDSESLSDSYKRTYMDSGSQIAKMMKQSKDPAEFRAQLTDSQLRLLETHTSKNRDRLLQDIQARVREKIDKAGFCVNRNVVSLLKIRVAGVTEKGDNVAVSKGMISIWKPNDAIQEVIKEGTWIDVLNVIPTAVRYSEIQISASRQSVFSTSRYKEPDKFKPYTKLLQRQWYTIKDLAQNPSMTTDYNEIDTIGIIFLIDPSIKEFDSTKQSFQNVYLADTDKNIICANFWGGLQKFGFQNVLETGQVIACVNLQKRAGNTRKSIPQFRVTEFSYFTQTPKNIIARKMLEDFNTKLNGLDRRKFCQDCVILKNSFSITKNNENISPYRCMNTDISMSKNKVFIDSPLLKLNKIDDNFNLTGLDFESTFKQDTQLSEEMLRRKKNVNEKIARLKMYGEPPPLSPIHIINRSKQACSSYKSPLLSSNNNSANENSNLKTVDRRYTKSVSSVNVTSKENTPQKFGVQREISTSPVLLNRTYVKSVNPVKINFDVQENNDSNIDHFAEEFEGSPPLSLD